MEPGWERDIKFHEGWGLHLCGGGGGADDSGGSGGVYSSSGSSGVGRSSGVGESLQYRSSGSGQFMSI